VGITYKANSVIFYFNISSLSEQEISGV